VSNLQDGNQSGFEGPRCIPFDVSFKVLLVKASVGGLDALKFGVGCSAEDLY